MPSSLDLAMPIPDLAVGGNPARVAEERIRVVNPLVMDDWDAQVQQLPGHTVFHGSAWLRVLQATYGFVPCCLAEYQSGRLSALLPMVEVRSRLTGNRGVALPFADFCPPLASDLATEQALIQRALELAKSRRWKTLEWRGSCSYLQAPSSEHGSLSTDNRSLTSGSCSPLQIPSSLRFLTHTLDLKPGEDRLYHRFASSVRRALRKAEQAGVKAAICHSEDALEIFHQLYCITRQRHGLPPQPVKFFRQIHQQIIARGQGFIVEATHQDRPVASAVFFTCGKQALYKYGASDHTAQELRANNFVMWTAIKSLISREFESLHLGRTSLANGGLRRFKQSWTPVEERLDYYCYNLRKAQYITQPDQAQGWHTRLFQKVPISLARIIGALLYPHTA